MNGQRHVNVVFKGGGAKGAAYAGAVRALEEADFTIRSASGSSAGAITAALVVAGCGSDVLATISATVMTKLRPRPVRTRMSAVFDPTLLGAAIEEQLRKSIGRSIGVDRVTFGELFAHTGRGLYIVTLDLATSQPRIFHHLTTPDISVTDAVLASCAIPGLFPPGRLVVDRTDGRVVHVLVDGGAWANFPLFIYADPGFRAWLLDASTGGRADHRRSSVADLLEAETGTDRETIAFDLAADDVAEVCSGHERGFIAGRRGRQWDLGPAGSAGTIGTYLSAVLLRGRTRYLVLFAAIVWVLSTAASWPDTVRAMNAFLVRLPSPLFAAATTAVAVAAALLVLTVVAAVVSVLVVGPLVSDTVVPAAKSAFGVATGVVPWASAYRSVSLVRLPTAPMTTTRFRASRDVVQSVIDEAARATHMQLGTATAPYDNLDEAHPSPSVERRALTTRRASSRVATGVALVSAVALVAVVVGWMLRAISIGPDLVRVVLLASAAVVGPVLVVQHAAADRRRGAALGTRSK